MEQNIFLSTVGVDEWVKYETIWFVSSEVIIWANFVKDIFASITDFFGGRSNKYERSLVEAKNNALDELISKAINNWGNGIIWIKMDYEAIWAKWSMFMVNVSWTLIKIK